MKKGKKCTIIRSKDGSIACARDRYGKITATIENQTYSIDSSVQYYVKTAVFNPHTNKYAETYGCRLNPQTLPQNLFFVIDELEKMVNAL